MHEPTGVSLLIIGTELLTGKRLDSHLSFAITALAERALELDQATYLGDDPSRLRETLRTSMLQHDITFVFGGIGATPDDYTRRCAAEAAGLELVLHPRASAIIEARFGAKAYPQRINMAYLPQGCELIPNPVNQIPGFSLADHHFVPGFPQMAQPMMEWVLDSRYRHLQSKSVISEQLLTLPGTSEGQLIKLLEDFVRQFPGLRLSCLPHMQDHYRETELGVRGATDSVNEAMSWLREKLQGQEIQWFEGGR